MRIAHIITRLILGGAGKHAADVRGSAARLWRRRAAGHRSAAGAGGQLARAGPAQRRAAGRSCPHLRRAIHPLARSDEVTCRSNARIRRLPARRRPHAQRQGRPARPRGRALLWACRRSSTRVHGAPFHPYQSRVARAVLSPCERWAARRCHALVSVADAMTELMVAAGVAPREKFTTIYSGMEVEPFLARRRSIARATAPSWATADEHVVDRQDRADCSSQGPRIRHSRRAAGDRRQPQRAVSVRRRRRC